MKDIVLIGGGGHCKSVIDTIKSSNEYNIIGILDIKEKVGTRISNIKIIGTDDDMEKIYKSGIKHAFITIGSIGNPNLRIKLYKEAKDIGYKIPCIIDKTSIISPNLTIKNGTFIGKGVIINSGVKIGENTILNTGSIIEHDCEIGSYVHIAPGTTLSGNVIIGNRSHIGTNSTIIQNINIGEDSIIGAGSVVIKDIENNKKAYGNPCQEVK